MTDEFWFLAGAGLWSFLLLLGVAAVTAAVRPRRCRGGCQCTMLDRAGVEAIPPPKEGYLVPEPEIPTVAILSMLLQRRLPKEEKSE